MDLRCVYFVCCRFSLRVDAGHWQLSSKNTIGDIMLKLAGLRWARGMAQPLSIAEFHVACGDCICMSEYLPQGWKGRSDQDDSTSDTEASYGRSASEADEDSARSYGSDEREEIMASSSQDDIRSTRNARSVPRTPRRKVRGTRFFKDGSEESTYEEPVETSSVNVERRRSTLSDASDEGRDTSAHGDGPGGDYDGYESDAAAGANGSHIDTGACDSDMYDSGGYDSSDDEFDAGEPFCVLNHQMYKRYAHQFYPWSLVVRGAEPTSACCMRFYGRYGRIPGDWLSVPAHHRVRQWQHDNGMEAPPIPFDATHVITCVPPSAVRQAMRAGFQSVQYLHDVCLLVPVSTSQTVYAPLYVNLASEEGPQSHVATSRAASFEQATQWHPSLVEHEAQSEELEVPCQNWGAPTEVGWYVMALQLEEAIESDALVCGVLKRSFVVYCCDDVDAVLSRPRGFVGGREELASLFTDLFFFRWAAPDKPAWSALSLMEWIIVLEHGTWGTPERLPSGGIHCAESFPTACLDAATASVLSDGQATDRRQVAKKPSDESIAFICNFFHSPTRARARDAAAAAAVPLVGQYVPISEAGARKGVALPQNLDIPRPKRRRLKREGSMCTRERGTRSDRRPRVTSSDVSDRETGDPTWRGAGASTGSIAAPVRGCEVKAIEPISTVRRLSEQDSLGANPSSGLPLYVSSSGSHVVGHPQTPLPNHPGGPEDMGQRSLSSTLVTVGGRSGTSPVMASYASPVGTVAGVSPETQSDSGMHPTWQPKLVQVGGRFGHVHPGDPNVGRGNTSVIAPEECSSSREGNHAMSLSGMSDAGTYGNDDGDGRREDDEDENRYGVEGDSDSYRASVGQRTRSGTGTSKVCVSNDGDSTVPTSASGSELCLPDGSTKRGKRSDAKAASVRSPFVPYIKCVSSDDVGQYVFKTKKLLSPEDVPRNAYEHLTGRHCPVEHSQVVAWSGISAAADKMRGWTASRVKHRRFYIPVLLPGEERGSGEVSMVESDNTQSYVVILVWNTSKIKLTKKRLVWCPCTSPDLTCEDANVKSSFHFFSHMVRRRACKNHSAAESVDVMAAMFLKQFKVFIEKLAFYRWSPPGNTMPLTFAELNSCLAAAADVSP